MFLGMLRFGVGAIYEFGVQRTIVHMFVGEVLSLEPPQKFTPIMPFSGTAVEIIRRCPLSCRQSAGRDLLRHMWCRAKVQAAAGLCSIF